MLFKKVRKEVKEEIKEPITPKVSEPHYLILDNQKMDHESINVPTNWLLTSPHNDEDRYIKGIRMHRYSWSWVNAGGDIHDHHGFIVWMINIPFLNCETGEIEHISQDDAQDAYDMMKGKSELDYTVRDFLKCWDPKSNEYLTETDHILKLKSQGKTAKEISNELNIPAKQIYKLYRELHIKE